MNVEYEKKLPVKFKDLCEFVYEIDNLNKWVVFLEDTQEVTISKEIRGSYISMSINLFRKPISFNFRISEFEKNSKIRIKAKLPFVFEITIRTFQAVDGSCYVKLKTICKPRSIFFMFKKRKLRAKNKISIEILEELFRKQQFNF